MGYTDSDSRWNGQEIAVIGMSFRMPGAETPDEFWAMLRDGVEAATVSTASDLSRAGIDPLLASDPRYITAAGRLRDIAGFDARFFGYSPKEAAQMDPQQRWFLTCAWEAIEKAGYDLTRWNGVVGVFAGCRTSTYAELLRGVQTEGPDFSALGNEKDFLATTVAYKMNLKGPAVNVQTACSTSLVSVILASESLVHYQSDLALAGAVSILVPQESGYFYVENGVMSPDGHCRAFDRNARGCFPGNGVAVFALKRLADALRDRDRIEAVIRGWGLNNDGARRVGYTAPSVAGQAEAVAMALAHAQVPAESIEYIETHGTGTPLGDMVEIAALTKAFQSETRKTKFCAIGSVKTNIGHTDTVSGAAGLIKTILCLRHRKFVPSLHFEEPLDSIDYPESPFFVNTLLREWSRATEPRRAGVSSFGLGGTNAHIILEEAPPVQILPSNLKAHVFLVSAKKASLADTALLQLGHHMAARSDLSAADVAHTLQTGRQAFEHRRAVISPSTATAADLIHQAAGVIRGFACSELRKIVFLFTGTGDEYPDMTADLYDAFPAFRADIDHGCACAAHLIGTNPISYLYTRERTSRHPASNLGVPDIRTLVHRARSVDRTRAAGLSSTVICHVLVFLTGYALARLWRSLGISPAAMIGYSLGEFTAATIAEVFTLEDALNTVITRAKLIESQSEGLMLSVPLSHAEARDYAPASVSIAAINGPEMCVLSGSPSGIAEVEQRLSSEGIAFKRLPSTRAFHSNDLQSAANQLARFMRTVPMEPPTIPYISTVTGDWVTARQAVDPEHWAQHTVSTVRFSDGIRLLIKTPNTTLIEIGPGQSLISFATQHRPLPPSLVTVASTPYELEEANGLTFFLENAATAWVAGTDFNWAALYDGESRHRVDLPTYPLELTPHWIEPTRHSNSAPSTLVPHTENVANWIYVAGWRSACLDGHDTSSEECDAWLIFAIEHHASDGAVRELRSQGRRVITVHEGTAFESQGDSFVVDAMDASNYARIATSLSGKGMLRVLYFWAAAAPRKQETYAPLYRFILFVQSFAPKFRLDIDIISSGTQDVNGDEPIEPSHSALLSICRVAPQEFADCRCRHIDIGPLETFYLTGLLTEINSFVPGTTIAWRGKRRWLRTYEVVPTTDGRLSIRRNGTYIITGGLGRIALHLAEHLASQYAANIVLISRHAPSNVRERQALDGMQNRGLGIQIAVADVANELAMTEIFEHALERWGRVDGIIHAAGTPHAHAMRTIAELSSEHFAEHFRAKADGVRVLQRLINRFRPDFCVLMSSLSTLLGGLGMTAYAAANEYMSCVAIEASRTSQTRWLSIDWDSWDAGDLIPADAPSVHPFNRVMSSEEGTKVFLRALSARAYTRLAVSISGIDGRLAVALVPDHQQLGGNSVLHPRPELANEYVPPTTEAEQTLSEIWMEILGVDRIGIHDNFFRLGGHSLLGIRMLARIRQEFGVDVPIRSLFQHPTIANLCDCVMMSLAEIAAKTIDVGDLVRETGAA